MCSDFKYAIHLHVQSILMCSVPICSQRSSHAQFLQENVPASHEHNGKLVPKSSTASSGYPAATPPPVVPIDTRPSAASPYPMASPDPMPTRCEIGC